MLIITDLINRTGALGPSKPELLDVSYRGSQGTPAYHEETVVAGYRNRLQQFHAAFSRQFDSRADRGNSDFDPRHNLVFLSAWEPPGPLRQRKAAQIAAVRSGFPPANAHP